ncbi:MAG: beta-1,6-glucan synthase [Rhodocyclaceae bacterium]|nr:beta-1,6-glucan synthase [Rhodocyclaceae bacterium]
MPRFSSSSGWRWLAGLHLLALLAALVWLVGEMQAVALPDAAGQRIRCVSYSPFHRPGLSPLDPSARITPAQIREDLQALTSMTGCVRTYAVDQGLEAVPEIAGALGMSVLLGAWIGRDEAANERQLERLVALARAHPETVRGVIVGNEVLLRGEQEAPAMARYLARVRAQVPVPVSYADVWEFWLRHPELAREVDVVTVHVLPFWEDEPVSVEQAVAHVVAIRRQISATFDRPILVGETGWPSVGRQRDGAAPGRIAQARFVRELLLQANREGWDYNLIEAFDQPWKRRLEGTVGGYWGVLDGKGRPHFPLDGPVAERAGWGGLPWAALVGATILAGAAALARRRREWQIAWGIAGLWAGLALGLAVEHAMVAWRDWREWLVLSAVAALGPAWLVATAGGLRLRWREGLRLAVLFCAATGALWLAVDPRYRDFPWWLYAGVAPSMALIRPSGDSRSLAIVAAVLVLAGLARVLPEPTNPQALAWFVLCLLLAAGGWPAGQQEQREQGRDRGRFDVV